MNLLSNIVFRDHAPMASAFNLRDSPAAVQEQQPADAAVAQAPSSWTTAPRVARPNRPARAKNAVVVSNSRSDTTTDTQQRSHAPPLATEPHSLVPHEPAPRGGAADQDAQVVVVVPPATRTDITCEQDSDRPADMAEMAAGPAAADDVVERVDVTPPSRRAGCAMPEGWVNFRPDVPMEPMGFDEGTNEFTADERVLRGIYAYGLERATRLQRQTVAAIVTTDPELLESDVLVLGRGGTGKTTALAMAAVAFAAQVEPVQRPSDGSSDDPTAGRPGPRVLMLTNSREASNQLASAVTSLGEYVDRDLDTGRLCGGHAFTGGTSVRPDIRRLEESQTCPRVAVGAPGRVLDLIKRGALVVAGIEVLMIDEADELLGSENSGGFVNTIYDIFKYLPKATRVVIAMTLPPAELLLDICPKFMRAVRVCGCLPPRVGEGEPTDWDGGDERLVSEVLPPAVRHLYEVADRRHRSVGGDLATAATKVAAMVRRLPRLLAADGMDATNASVMVFASNRSRVDQFAELLATAGCPCIHVHADMCQDERQQAVRDFGSGAGPQVLVCTEQLARAVNFPSVGLVVNLGVPSLVQYVTRAGRAGRFGRNGIVVTIAFGGATTLLSLADDLQDQTGEILTFEPFPW